MQTNSAIKQIVKDKFWIVVLFVSSCVFILNTNPFLRVPFDPWEHLIKIRSIFDEGRCFLYWPESKSTFCAWHQMWAGIFKIANIDNTFTWAKIIHFSQFLFSLLAVFYFSYIVIKLIQKNIPDNQLIFLGFFSTLYWFVGNGTFSVNYQQAWVIWYSLTYQGLTIPLFWLITGFTLILSFEQRLSYLKLTTLSILVVGGFLVITYFHPSEAIYYFIFLVLSLLFTPKIPLKQKVIGGSAVVLIVPIILIVVANTIHLPFMQGVSFRSDLPDIIQQINVISQKIVQGGGNRLRSSFSELAMLSCIIAFIYWGARLFVLKNRPTRIFYLFIVALIIFYIIPTNKWAAGITGLLLHEHIVWRFFFASPWFIFIPLFIFSIVRHLRFPRLYGSTMLMIILSCTFLLSDFYLNKAISGNIRSLFSMFDTQRMGLQYDGETISYLKKKIESETKGVPKKNVMLYLRGDLATIARAVYGYYALAHRRTYIPMHKFYFDRMDRKYNLVPIVLPVDFPKDRKIFLHFNLDVKRISNSIDPVLEGENPVKFKLEHTDVSRTYVYIEGWAFLKGQIGPPVVHVVLQSDQDTITFDTSQLYRRDVGKYFKSIEIENTGFLATVKIKDLQKGTYRIGLLVEQNGHQGYVMSGRKITVPNKKYQ